MASADSKTLGMIASSALVLMLAALIAGCAQPSRLERSSLTESVPPEQALALPPPGGPAVVGVVERRYSNAVQQDVVLAADSTVPGQNMLRVQIFGPIGSQGGDTALIDSQLADSEVSREMRSLFPGVVMARSPLYAQNSYGPFGYATGRRGARDLCLYAWQRIAPSPAAQPFVNRGRIHVRLRVCQSGATEQSLLGIMYGYTINASFSSPSWRPFGQAPAADPRLGVTGQPIHPLGASGPEAVFAPVPVEAPVHRPAPRAPTPSPAPLPPTDSPPAGAPVVPPPPAGEVPAAPVVPAPPEG